MNRPAEKTNQLNQTLLHCTVRDLRGRRVMSKTLAKQFDFDKANLVAGIVGVNMIFEQNYFKQISANAYWDSF
jgi:hypothetical protein